MRAVDLPIVHPTSSIVEIINTISKGRLGLTLVNNGEETVGIITDGDLRRLFEAEGIDSWSKVASQIMTQSPRWVSLGTSLHVAEKILQDSKITSLLVVHENGSTAGIIQIYDLI